MPSVTRADFENRIEEDSITGYCKLHIQKNYV
jgi:hypothetical protein